MRIQLQRRRHLLPALALLGIACGSNPPAADTGRPDLGTVDTILGDHTLPSPDHAPDSRPAACLAQNSKLQAALDGARKSPNAMLAVRNVACGTSVYLSGDPSTATTASLWRVGSVTKTYVAATVLALCATGTLALEDPLSKWVSGVAQTNGVTLRMLLNHTSGIFNVTEDPSFGADPKRVWTPAEVVALATKHDPYFAPGAGWKYSNTNFILLGMVLEKAGAAKVSALLRKHALGPAGLAQTFLEGEEPLQGKVAAGFDVKKNNITDAFSMSGPWAAGAMVASGADLCDWVATLYGSSKVLDDAHRKLLTEGAIVTSAVSKYGLGVELLDASITAGAGPAIGHGGSIHGSHTQAYWFPDKQTAICAVVNQDGVDANDVTLAALLALFK